MVRPSKCPRIDFRVVCFQRIIRFCRVFCKKAPKHPPMRVSRMEFRLLEFGFPMPEREARDIIIINLTLDLYLLLRAGFDRAGALDFWVARFMGKRIGVTHAHGGMIRDNFDKNATFFGSALFYMVLNFQFWTFGWTWHGHLDTFRAKNGVLSRESRDNFTIFKRKS